MSPMSLRPLARSPWLVPSLGLLALCLAAPPASADEDACGPEIKPKEVEIYEVEAEHPHTRLEELQDSEGVSWEVVAREEVRSDSSPARRARIQAARRGCPVVIVGQVRLVDSSTTISVGGGFGGAPSARRGWLKVAHVLYAEPAQDGVKTADAGPER